MRDRVAQEVLRRLLSPLFEPLFHDDSHGFRPGRSCHSAMERLLETWRSGHRHVVDADISGFFDGIPHEVIMRGLVQCGRGWEYPAACSKVSHRRYSGGTASCAVRNTASVHLQVGSLSPLLANIASQLPRLASGRIAGYRFVRYADDFVVLCHSEAEAKEALAQIEPLLHDRLGLTLSSEKTTISRFRDGFSFLGFEISSWSVKMRSKSVENFKMKVRQITRRSHNLDAELIEKLNRVIRGTANYFATPWSHCGDAYRSLDRWIRMRLRCMKSKRKSKVDNVRIRLKHLKNMGLLSLSDLRTSGTG